MATEGETQAQVVSAGAVDEEETPQLVETPVETIAEVLAFRDTSK